MKNNISLIKQYFRLANYIGAAQIYLQDNVLLERPLSSSDIKSRLLGHWGTVPGLNLIYVCLNNLICKTGAEVIYVTGPGHGFPAIQGNLFLEASLSKMYKDIPYNKKGFEKVVRQFSWPYGYPSHLNPGAPGCIVEGGELGYSLSTSFGAVFDNPDLIVACVVGDGESETASINAAWHSVKFLNPKTSGAVLPIVHLNGYKISGPTVFAMMSNNEIKSYFKGLGYEALIVEQGKGEDAIFSNMAGALDKAYIKIKKIQNDARVLNKIKVSSGWPVIILKTPKGWTGTNSYKGLKIEGASKSHQVILGECKSDPDQLKELEKWFKSYKIEELINSGVPNQHLQKLIPKGNLKMGLNSHANDGKRKDLILPKLGSLKADMGKNLSAMKKAGEFLKELFVLNENNKNFRIFSPDETYSNKIDKVFEVTSRACLKKPNKWDIDLAPDGRVMEMLSENTLQGWFEGYLLTGRHGIFVSYEAFIEVVSSMADQYIKFMYQSKEIPWRKPLSSLNYILTSLLWRQDHNGYSHQNPAFISGLLDKHGDYVSVYFPVDSNSMLVCLEEVFKEEDNVNVIVAGKREEAQYLSISEAKAQLKKGAGIWDFMSDKNPDIVFASAGDYVSAEMIEGLSILKEHIPEVKARYVNVCKLTAFGIGTEKGALSEKEFTDMFTKGKSVIFSFHGYANDIKKLLFGKVDIDRFKVFGYKEEGSTTTPFDMMIRNGVSRYQVVINACKELIKSKPGLKNKCVKLIKKLEITIKEHREYIIEYGVDPEDLNKL